MIDGAAPAAALATAVAGGAVCALDAAPLAQTLLSQPLPAAVLTGVALHCVDVAAPVGIGLQVLWTALLPLGGSLIPDSGPALVGAVAAAALLRASGPDAAAWALPVCVGMAMAGSWSGAQTVMWARRWNHRLVRGAEERVLAGDIAGLERAHALALLLSAARGAMLGLTVAAAGWGLGLLLAQAAGTHGAALCAQAARWLVPAGLGVLAAASWMRSRRGPWWLAAGLATATGIAWLA